MMFLFSLSLTSVPCFSKDLIQKVIYGIDDRMDVYQSQDKLLKQLSLSTAAQVSRDNFNSDGILFHLTGKTLEEQGICKSERFSSQIAPADCSGFLVAPDVLVTAGHCVTSMTGCESNYWVFDFANRKSENNDFTFTSDQVFYCTEIIQQIKDSTSLNDFAVVRLNRAVPNRNSLKLRTDGKIDDNAKVAVLGYPTGLPLKITSNASMRDNTDPVFFRMNSDTYGGNSGSAVVDMKTGLVEGILVRGDTDFVKGDNACYSSVIRAESDGRGEDATRITNIHF
jgi:V8-like Glu-specific endopeptidase